MKTVSVSKGLNTAIMRKGRSQSPQMSTMKSTMMSPKGIELLKKQNQNMKEEISLEEKNSHNTEMQLMQKLNTLQEQGSSLAKRIEIENKRYTLLQKELLMTKSQIQNKKTVVQGQGESNVNESTQKLKILEHRQEKYMQKNNELFATILKTKDQLKAARRERVIFDNIFTSIESDLKKKEEEIKSLILVSSQIEIYKRELDCLQQQIQEVYDLEQQFFSETCKQTLKTPTQDLESTELRRKTTQFVSTSFDSEDDDGNLSEPNNEIDSYDQTQTYYNNTNYVTQPIMEKIEQEQDIDNSDQLIPIRKIQKEIDEYQAQLDRLKSGAQSTSIQQFLDNYKNYEETNQNLFQQSQTWQEKISDIEKELEKTQDCSLDKSENITQVIQLDNRNEQLDSKSRITSKIEQIKENNIQISAENEHILAALQKLADVLPSILEKINCNTEEYLKENFYINIHPNNLLQFLQVLEQRVDEILQVEQAVEKNNLYKKTFGGLPFNLEKLIEKEKKLGFINEVIDNLEKQKEGDKIMSIQELHAASDKEVSKHLQSLQSKSNLGTFYQNPSTNNELSLKSRHQLLKQSHNQFK